MRALSIRQPWTWAILHAGKRVENRTWPAPESAIGETIAIHAGRSYDHEGRAWIEQTLGRYVPLCKSARGAIVGTARLAACERITGILRRDLTPWHCGPWCWALDDVRPLSEPVPCKGRLGLWSLDAETARLVAQRARVTP